MSYSDVSMSKKYASIAEVAAAQCKLYTEEAIKAPEYTNLAKQYAEDASISSLSAETSYQQALAASQSSANSAAESEASEQVSKQASLDAQASASSAGDSATSAEQSASEAIASVNKTIRVTDADLPALPVASVRANKALTFDSNGNAVVSVPSSGSAQDVLDQLSLPSGASLVGYGSGTLSDVAEAVSNKLSGNSTFSDGATLSSQLDFVYDSASNEYYYWTGSFPKVVPPSSSPLNTGGIGLGAWGCAGSSGLSIDLSQPTGSSHVGHGGKTVGQYLDGIGKMVFPGDDLKAVLDSASENDTVHIIGDVSLSQSVVLTKSVSIECSKGRILWSGTGNCIRYIPPVLQTYTDAIVFVGGQNSTQFPVGHTVQAGQLLCCYSSERRAGASLGDYFRGQYFVVRKVDGQQVEFYPSVLEGFTSNKIEVRKPTANMQHYFRLKQTTPTGTPGGVIFDMPYSLNCSGYVELDCNRDPNVGFGIGGHNHSFRFNIQGITNGASGYNVSGYGIGATGTRMHFEGTGSNCRHLVEIPDGSILSADIHFDINATKEVGNPLYLYIAGAHCNVLGWSLTGRISGSGGMVCDRSGTAHFKDIHFDCQDDGYGDGYGCIAIANLYPTQTMIENVTMTVSGSKRKSLVEWDIQGQSTQNGLLVIKGCITKGRCRIIKIRDTGVGAATHTYRFRIEGCSGEASSIHNRDIANSNVFIELFDNTWSTTGLDNFPDYMAGSDSTGCKVYEAHLANNIIDDTNTSGVFSFNGYMDAIDFSCSSDKNQAKPFINLTPTYLGSVVRMDINGLATKGKMSLTPTSTTTYQDIGQVRFCKIGIDDSNPISVGLSWPIIYTGNSFNNSFDAVLVSTKRPQGANVSLKGKALNWNGTNIAV